MSETESAILSALNDLESAVNVISTTAAKPNLLPLFARIDELATALPPTADATLLHYLRKKSYEKARLFLEGRDSDNQAGNCRHVG